MLIAEDYITRGQGARLKRQRCLLFAAADQDGGKYQI